MALHAIEREWQRLAAIMKKNGGTPEQVDHCRSVFYAGAHAMFYGLAETKGMPRDQAFSEVDALKGAVDSHRSGVLAQNWRKH